jgi:hypothetical protein
VDPDDDDDDDADFLPRLRFSVVLFAHIKFPFPPRAG